MWVRVGGIKFACPNSCNQKYWNVCPHRNQGRVCDPPSEENGSVSRLLRATKWEKLKIQGAQPEAMEL